MAKAKPKPDEPLEERETTLGERLTTARESLGLSRTQAADKLGISYQGWADLEAGRRNASLERLHEIALTLGVDPNVLDPRLASTAASADTEEIKVLREALENAAKLLAKFGKPKGKGD